MKPTVMIIGPTPFLFYGEPWGVYLSTAASARFIYPVAIIRKNHFRHIAGVSSPIKRDGGIVARGCEGLVIERNVILVDLAAIVAEPYGHAKSFNNQTPSGLLTQVYNDAPSVTALLNELATDVDLAADLMF